jgi:hypothetical protein
MKLGSSYRYRHFGVEGKKTEIIHLIRVSELVIRRIQNIKKLLHQRRARDSNPQGLAPAGFQDRCNSRSASSPIPAFVCNIRNDASEFNPTRRDVFVARPLSTNLMKLKHIISRCNMIPLLHSKSASATAAVTSARVSFFQ